MKSKWFSLSSVLIASFGSARSKQVDWTREASIQTGYAGNLSCTNLSELRSMKFFAMPTFGTDRLDCIDCALSGTPTDVLCINKDYKRAVPPHWECSTVFPRSGFRIVGFSMNCDFKDARHCYEPGICRLSIFVGRNQSQMVRIALIAVGVMTIFALLLLWIKHCTRKAQTPARSRVVRPRDLPVRREAPAGNLRRSVQNSNSPDVQRAVTVPVRAPPPTRASQSHLDDPPPSYEQVIAASK